jgi:catechol 2,3-dioxygenase-like lactoylglutathione lyase family enzyme
MPPAGGWGGIVMARAYARIAESPGEVLPRKPTDPILLGVRLRVLVWEDLTMTTPLLGLRTVIYPAPDLEAAKAWWTTLLGVTPYFDEAFYVGFSVGGYELGLLPTADPADGALTYWGVADVSAAVAASIAQGATEHTPAAEVGDDIVTATVRTPQGTIVGFIYNPHFSPTEHRPPPG